MYHFDTSENQRRTVKKSWIPCYVTLEKSLFQMLSYARAEGEFP